MAYMAKIEYKNYSHQVGVKEVLRRYWNTLILCSFFCCGIWEGRDQSEVDELVVHLDESLEISSMEQGVKLVGAVLSKKPLNKWGVKNKLGSRYVFIIVVNVEDSANQIIIVNVISFYKKNSPLLLRYHMFMENNSKTFNLI
ncbi:unnamed protein product [Malus baccata var. baccata]